MKAITRNKWFLALLAFLLIANIAMLLSFFVFGERSDGHNGKKPAPQAEGYLSRQLNLDKSQSEQFKVMKKKFFAEMEPVWEDIRKSKDSLYTQVSNASLTDAQIAEYTARIAEKNRHADELMFRHFRELRGFCTPEQQKIFDTLVPKMMSRGQRPRGK